MMSQLQQKLSQLSNSVLCVENCKWKSWSFMSGLKLSDECPSNCSLTQLEGREAMFSGQTSRSRLAREAIAANEDVKSY